MSNRRIALAFGVACAAALTAGVCAASSASAQQLGNTGSGRPALAPVGSRLYIAWTGSSGTPAARDLNLGWSTSEGARIQKVLHGEKSPQNEGPALLADGATPQSSTGVFMAWPAGNAGNTLTAAFFDGTSVTCRTAFAGITTPHSPALAQDPSGARFVGWVDESAHLNIARLDSSTCATTHTMSLTAPVVLPDTSVAGPSLAYDLTSAGLGMMIAWSGTDSAHLVKVATYNGTTTLTNRGTVDLPVGSLTGPSIGTQYADNYLSFQGTDGLAYLAYSEGRQPAGFQGSGSVYSHGLSSAIGLDDPVNRRAYFDATGHLNISFFCCNAE